MSEFITNGELRIEAERLCEENDRLRELVQDMCECFRIGARSGEGIDRQWCRELFDSYVDIMRKLGIEVYVMSKHELVEIGLEECWPESVRVYRNHRSEVLEYFPERTCTYDFIPNIGNGHLNSCGLKCSACGREQMNLVAPAYCPDCGCKVMDSE